MTRRTNGRVLHEDLYHFRFAAKVNSMLLRRGLEKCQLTVIRPVAPVVLRVPLGLGVDLQLGGAAVTARILRPMGSLLLATQVIRNKQQYDVMGLFSRLFVYSLLWQ